MAEHDALFKHVFSVPEHAAAELAHVLPAELSSRIAWDTLRLERGSFVDAELAEKHTDLLSSAKLSGRAAYLYLLYEHQSQLDPWMPLRTAAYVVRILEAHRKEHPGARRVPVVLVVVLHHGRGGWSAARAMADLYDADRELLDVLGDRVLGLSIEVDDLASMPASAIAARTLPPLIRVVLGALRDARELSLEALLARWRGVMIEAAGSAGREALAAVLQYLMEVHGIEDPSEMSRRVRAQGGAELEEVAMNAFDRLRAEGEAKGRADTILRLLALKFGAPTQQVVARVRSASIPELDCFAERILSAASVDDVLTPS